MDDNTIFNNQQNSNEPNTAGGPDQTDKPLTVQDLYGPSTAEPVSAVENPAVPNATQSTSSPETVSVQPNVESQQIPSQAEAAYTGATQADVNQSADSYYPPPTAIPPANPLTALFGNKKLLIIIGGAVGGLFFLIIIIGIISRLMPPKDRTAYSNATLIYWGLWEEKKTLQPVIDEFEKKYPGIKIQYEKRDPLKYKERLITRITNGTEAPDIFTFHNTWVPTLTSSSDNILLPLPTDTISPDNFKKEYFTVVQTDLTKNGAIYGLPQGIDTLALFVNKDILIAAGRKTPETWEEFNAAAKVLTVKDDNGKILTAGAAIGTFDNITHAADIISLLLVTNGVKLQEIDKQENVKEFMQGTLSYYTSFASSYDNIWEKTMNESRDLFAAGDLAMYFGYSWDIFAITSLNKNLQFEIHPVPYLPKEGSSPMKTTIASYWANGVSQKSKHQKEALLFLKFLAQKENIQKIYTEASKIRTFGMPYARKDLAETLQDNSVINPFVDQADNAVSSYFASDTNDTLYNGPLNDYLGNAIRQINSSVSIESAVETLIKGVIEVRSKSL